MATGKKSMSLHEFKVRQLFKDCPICNLPSEILSQISEASGNVPRKVVLAWLNDEAGYAIKASDLERHYNGRHDQRKEELEDE